MDLKLKRGVDPQLAIDLFKTLTVDAQNRRGIGHDAAAAKQQLEQWAELAEMSLTNYFTISSVLGFIHTDRFLQIMNMDMSGQRASATLRAELNSQADRLVEATAELQEVIKCYKAASGRPIVPDTTAVLRMKPLMTLDWSSLVDRQPARLVLPLRVVEELDAKKYGQNDEFRNVVRKLLSRLEALLDTADDPVVQVSPLLTIEVLVLPGPRHRPVDADEEIIVTSLQLQDFVQTPVTIVTLDTSMRTRARASGLRPMRPPGDFLRGAELRWQQEAASESEDY